MFAIECIYICVCVCVCVCNIYIYICVCVCVCVQFRYRRVKFQGPWVNLQGKTLANPLVCCFEWWLMVAFKNMILRPSWWIHIGEMGLISNGRLDLNSFNHPSKSCHQRISAIVAIAACYSSMVTSIFPYISIPHKFMVCKQILQISFNCQKPWQKPWRPRYPKIAR